MKEGFRQKLDNLRHLASCDPEAERFLREHEREITLIPNSDPKCVIFSVDPEGKEVIKYIVEGNERFVPERLGDSLASIVRRGMRAQMVAQGPGVQVLKRSGFYEDVRGLIGPFEYVEGFNLGHIPRDEEGIPKDERFKSPRYIFNLFRDLDNILVSVHLKGVLHGDIKPSNLVLGKDGKLVVIDWSTARTFTEDCSVCETEVGTPLFFYPYRDDKSRDYWAMAFSYAKVLDDSLVWVPKMIENDPEGLVNFFYRVINNRFGKEYADFFRDLAGRSLEYSKDAFRNAGLPRVVGVRRSSDTFGDVTARMVGATQDWMLSKRLNNK
jgi:serine/threonine protein kinase